MTLFKPTTEEIPIFNINKSTFSRFTQVTKWNLFLLLQSHVNVLIKPL